MLTLGYCLDPVDRASDLVDDVVPRGSVSVQQGTEYVMLSPFNRSDQTEGKNSLEFQFVVAIRVRGIRIRLQSPMSSGTAEAGGLQTGRVEVSMAFWIRKVDERNFTPVLDPGTSQEKVRTKVFLEDILTRAFLCI